MNLSKYSKIRQIKIMAGYLKRRQHHGASPKDVTIDSLYKYFKFAHLQNDTHLIKKALAYLRKEALLVLETKEENK